MGKYSREKNPRRKWWLLLVVLVSVFCIVFFAANGRFRVPVSSRAVSLVLSPFQSAVGWVGTQVTYLESEVWDFLTLHEQNKMLRNEVTQLRVQILQAQEYASENTRLREMLDYKNTATQFDLKAARVIGRESATWSSMIVINRGTVDGVHEDMPVVTPKGLVGRVVEAGPNSSKVQLIIDPRSSVGTLVQRPESRVNGIVEGDPDNPTMPRMVNIPKTADVQEGDVIVTSGFGGVFPKGLVVGIVSQLKIDTGGLLQVAILEPAVDFQKLEDVMVITASREAPPEPFQTPEQTPGTETDPAQEAKEAAQQAAAQQEAAQSGGQQVEAGQP
ncbi:MAG: rod shape-determining protein MreC [Selenomonas sp.]|nr:rod shape-determining protein MreC [Selenomonas sp.]